VTVQYMTLLTTHRTYACRLNLLKPSGNFTYHQV
jgi:hypothetical protein